MRWILLALALVTGIAWSDDPIPSDGEKTAPPQQHSKNTAKPTEKNQRVVEKHPIFVKIIDASKTEPDAAKDKQESSDKPPLIWGMTAEEATAIFTLALVIVGALTALLLICQSCLLRRSVKLARDEFNATHRPKIRVRSFSITDRVVTQITDCVLEFHMFNVGDSFAKIIDIVYASLWAKDAFDAIINFQNTQKTVAINSTINPGQLIKQSIPHIGHHEDLPGGGHYTYRPGLKFFVIGRITYQDQAGLTRNTGFARESSDINKSSVGICSFRKIEDADYEYED